MKLIISIGLLIFADLYISSQFMIFLSATFLFRIFLLRLFICILFLKMLVFLVGS